MRKYVAVALSAAAMVAAVAFVASGFIHTSRVERRTEDLRAAVHAMTLQDLAGAIARCEASSGPGGPPQPGPGRRDAAFCEDVTRELDNRPLQIVKPIEDGRQQH